MQSREADLIQYGDATQFVLPTGFAKTRAQKRAETIEAIRIGAIGDAEHNVFPTAEQLESIRLAGLKALPMDIAAR